MWHRTGAPSVDAMRTIDLLRRAVAVGAIGVLSLACAPVQAQTTDGTRPAPPPRWKWRSPALVWAGIGGIVVGLPTMLLGGLTMALFSGPYDEGANQTVNLLVSGGITVAGGAFIGCGIAGIVHGSAPVPVADQGTSLFPSLAIGPRSGALTWRF